MKHKQQIIAVLILLLAMLFTLSSCAPSDASTTTSENKEYYAIIIKPTGFCLRVDIRSLYLYHECGVIDIEATDGTKYTVHSTNCMVVERGK